MNKRVLVIEDNIDIRENIIEILELAEYTCYQASNGKEGLEISRAQLPNIILCDIMMPEMDGYEVLSELNKLPETGAIPFIFLTAKAEQLDLRKGMEMGADDYLTKPFDDIQLLNAIESRLKRQEIQIKHYSSLMDRINSLVSKKDGLFELKRIIEERKGRQFKKNQVIYYEGDKGNGLYVIIQGKIKTIKLEQDGRELMTGIYSTDDYLGVNVVLANEPYTNTATAIEDSLLCLIPKDQLDLLFLTYPDVVQSFIKILSDNIQQKEAQLLQLAYHSVRKKMAEAILLFHSKQDRKKNNFKISREDLAAMSGMATETVSRTLSNFKEEGIIDKKGGIITILDFQKLGNMKN